MYFVHISPITYSGKRTFSYDSYDKMKRMVLDKVLSDERTTAYVTDIADINKYWLGCKECNWYKSEQNILSEARISIQNITECYLICSQDPYTGWQSLKKFPFNEKLVMHLLHYQQVRYFYIGVDIYPVILSYLGWLHHQII